MKHQIREETWPVIDKFFQDMPEALWKLPTFKNALQSFQQDARREGELIGEQRVLIRQLSRKFPQLPHGIVQHIQTTFDHEQLDNWSDQIISATELSEISKSRNLNTVWVFVLSRPSYKLRSELQSNLPFRSCYFATARFSLKIYFASF